MKAKKFLSIIAILFIALISGCAGDDAVEVVGVCPIVISTNPVDGASGVPLSQIVKATFNEEMNPLTINQSSFTISVAGTPIAGTVTYSGKIATFTPASRLAVNTLYTGRITTEVKDVDGNALQTDYVWTFTTGLNPIVVSTDPANLAVDVALNKAITATFNMSMNPLTLNATTFTVKQGTATVLGTITYAGTMVTFTPSAPLAQNTVYTATITKGATNILGTELANDYVWTFKTGITPLVISTDPLNNATGVALNKVISATFNMPMNPLTLNAVTYTVKQGAIPVLGTISYSGSTVSFTPAVPLLSNTVYTATITTGAQNVNGTALASNYVWNFTTLSTTPFVVLTNPINNTTGVALNKVISATFNMPMNPLTLNATTYTVKQGAITVLGTISYSGSTVSFTPSAPLAENTLYTATITTGAQNTVGTAMVSAYTWNFTTLNSVIIPPTNNGLFFGVFGGNAGITNQGLNTRINNGGIGTTAEATLITGFTDVLASPNEVYTITPLNNGLVYGGIYAAAPAPGNATKAQKALEGLNEARALNNSISPAAKPGGSDQGSGELGGLTLAAGVYKSASGTYKITNGDLTLSGSATDVWIFQAESSLTVGSPAATRNVKLTGGALAKNVYWYVCSTAVINYAGGGVMTGNILAEDGVTLSSPGSSTTLPGQETVLNGRAISLVASVTMVNTIINVPTN